MEYLEIKYKGGVVNTNEIIDKVGFACIEHGLTSIDDLAECKSGKFENILRDVGHGFMRPLGVLYKEGSNTYDIDKLKVMLEIYIYLCIEYDKYISLNGYYSFCGLGERYINDIPPTLNGFSSYVRKRVNDADNERMQQRATDSKQALLNMAYVNYRHSWNGTINSNEMLATAKTLDDIRRERLQTSADSVQNARFGISTNENP